MLITVSIEREREKWGYWKNLFSIEPMFLEGIFSFEERTRLERSF